MGSTSGTSQLQWQKTISEATRELDLVALSIDGSVGEIPVDVGYFYVQLYINTIDPRLNYAHGILYREGCVVSLPPIQASSLANIEMWVRWKEPGLNWAAFF